jgi:hypothetical protein
LAHDPDLDSLRNEQRFKRIASQLSAA